MSLVKWRSAEARVEYARRFLSLVALILVPFLVTCDADVTGPVEPIGFGKAYGIWQPGRFDTCSAAVHDAYSAVGPNGMAYPTWHPPIDPATGCRFGHEHGRDPRGSDLYDLVGPIPFGYANDMLDIFDATRMRHEDHVGHKVEWENDFKLSFDNGGSAVLDISCDALVKLHQGTHSKDAFTNNMHELVYHIRCSDGTEMHVTVMATIGRPGEMVASCDNERVFRVGPATPATSPAGGGKRLIPDRECIERFMLAPPGERSNFHAALRENWEVSQSVRTANGRTLASFDPYFQVMLPSRFLDTSLPGLVGRPIDVCYELAPDGSRANGEECELATANGVVQGVAYDDPRSLFNGADRVVDINSSSLVSTTRAASVRARSSAAAVTTAASASTLPTDEDRETREIDSGPAGGGAPSQPRPGRRSGPLGSPAAPRSPFAGRYRPARGGLRRRPR
jgi:hypothetical protein